jgi:GT2 family glycosyltransferase
VTSPTLSVIIVNYNGGALVRDCLDHLWPQLEVGWEVFVVDNNSADGSVDHLEAAFGGLRLIRNRSNIGYARANNQALEVANGTYILLLNPDVQLGPGSLATAVTYLEENVDVSILGPKVLRPNGRLDPPARRSFKTPETYLYKAIGLSRLFPRHPRFGRYYLSYLDEGQVADVDSVVGAFLMIRRAVVKRIGPLDERFFMYCEDEDWCWRAKQAGGRVIYHPGVVVHHVKGASTSKDRLRMAFHWHRSLWLYHRKNLAGQYPAPINWMVYGGIGVGLAGAMTVGGVQRLAKAAADRLSRGGVPSS